MISDDELDEIQKYCDRATTGEWIATIFSSDITRVGGPDEIVADCRYTYEGKAEAYLSHRDNGNFIAKSRTDLPRLVNEVRKLKQALHKAAEIASEETRTDYYYDEESGELKVC